MNNSVNVEQKCSGCGLCSVICPVHAISMSKDCYGYIYPTINNETCIKCGRCTSVCPFNQTNTFQMPISTYAGFRNSPLIMKSSSGGVFAALAEFIIKDNGVVCGAKINHDFTVTHDVVEKIDDIYLLTGSKYVQSDLTGVFALIRDILNKGKKVLFCGTPCQVSSVQKYTGNPENLLCIEIICHGVPNQEMFRAYIKSIGDVDTFEFRDKRQGWSFNHKAVLKNGKCKKINHRLSSYMTFFMDGATYRKSCFSCPFAKKERNADITIGDFWGIIRKRPDLADKIDINKGVSAIIVNTKKGAWLIEKGDIILYPVEYDDIRDGNAPLNRSSEEPTYRGELLDEWAKELSWDYMNDYWKKHFFKVRFLFWAALPENVRNKIRLLLKLR